MKQHSISRRRGYFFAADHAKTRVAALGRVIREMFDATPLGIVVQVIRSTCAASRRADPRVVDLTERRAAGARIAVPVPQRKLRSVAKVGNIAR